jgi:hypothetical protein
MIVQTALLLLGGAFGDDGADIAGGVAEGDVDVDADFDADFDTAAPAGLDAGGGGDAGEYDISQAGDGLRIFTVRGIVAFLSIGGWTGLALLRYGEGVALLGAIVAGTAALLFAALVIRWVLRMQSSGNLMASNAIDHTATVYIPIPPGRASTGRVTMLLQGRFAELDAVTDSPTPLRTGESVRVIGVLGENCLIVRACEASEAGELQTVATNT